MVVEAVSYPGRPADCPIEVTQPEKMIPATLAICSKASVPEVTGPTPGRTGESGDLTRSTNKYRLTFPSSGITGKRSESCARTNAQAEIKINVKAASRRQQNPIMGHHPGYEVCSESLGNRYHAIAQAENVAVTDVTSSLWIASPFPLQIIFCLPSQGNQRNSRTGASLPDARGLMLAHNGTDSAGNG